MYRRIRSLRSAASIVFVTVLTIVSPQQARAGGGDLDNDGIPDGIDPCPSQPLNECAGPVAVDTATGNDIRVDTGPTCAATFTDCRGASWIPEWGDIVTLGSGYSHVLQSTVCSLPNGCPVNATSLFACTDVATETLFKCEHWDHPTNDPELNYGFDVPNGSYVVNLLFMNSFTGTAAAGTRVFDINIEGSPAFVGFDQVAIAGGPCDPAIAPCLPVVRAALVNVIDGNGLQLELIHVIENPSIKGIEVLVDLSGSGCTLDADCNDGNPCTTDTCNTGTGVCQFANNTDPCDDLVACTSGDVCAGGVCAGTDNCPMGDQCNTSTGLCEPIPECIVDADCAPAVPPCEGGELCIAGTCTAQPDAASGTACELDSDLCTIDECDGAGICANVGSVSCPVGEVCNPGNGQCAGPDADNDGLSDVTDPCPADPRNLCFGPVAVDGTTGTDIRLNANTSTAECAGAKLDCNGDVWAADFGFNQGNSATCNLAGGCPIGGIDAIFGAGCSGDAQFAETEDLFQCERWDAVAVPELQYSFDVPDGNYLVNMLLANSCTCTANPGDRIFDIVIESAPAYTNLDQVEAAGGSGIAVVRAALVTVADGNGLQIDFLHVLENPAIKAIEVLTAPACTTNADCTDGNPCTDDTCAAGSCTNPNNTAACDDGVACTTSDTCAGGACTGTPDDGLCDDSMECTNDVCTATGCTNDPTAAGTPCADDGNPCTDNACDGAGSCAASNNTAACDDGVACTTGDICAGGVCAGTPNDALCDDSNECTDDTCTAGGCDNAAVPDGTPCDDGFPGTPLDQCIAGVCVGEARVTVALVAVPTPTGADEVPALPASTTTYTVGDAFHIEVWAQTIETDGLSSVTVDLGYDASLTTASGLTNSAVFNQFISGTIDNGAGAVDDVGGSHPITSPPCDDQVGLEPSWAKVATIDMLAVFGGSQTVSVGDAASLLLGTAICNTLGNVDPAEILFEGVVVTTLCQGTDETCDGIDDNCSGTADDGYVSTPTACGVGACAASGTLECIGGSEVDSCVPGMPAAEICDGLDNDCNGIDDDEPDASASCVGGDFCSAGVCVAEARVTVALVAVPIPTAADEVGALPASTTTYNVGDSFHVEIWAQTIETDGLSSVTVDLGYDASLTTASGLINSAVFNQFTSGMIDNGAGAVDDVGGSHPITAPPCNDQVGLEPSWAKVATIDMLAVFGGSQTVSVGDAASPLLGTAICNTLGNVDPADMRFEGVVVTTLCQGADETCDGIDDDCNGTVDDGYVSTSTACGVGECAASGTLECLGGSEVDSCVPGMPVAEICDGLDNDCNGIDDDDPDASASCVGGDFCIGMFVCSGGSCVLGGESCPDECESCNADTQACEFCIFDHNMSGAIDGLDFGFFSGCFGSCYATTDICFDANYDGDVDGCVGGGDFGLFSGCFSLTCGECTLCFPWEGDPAPEGPDEGIVSVVAVPVARPSADDFGIELPGALKRLGVGQTFYVELWARADGFGDGLASAYVDIVFDPAHVDVRDHRATAQFPNFAHGAELLKGRIATLGGCAQLGDGALGSGGEWVRIGVVELVGRQAGEVPVFVEPARAPFGVSIFARPGDLAPSALHLDGTSVWVEDGRSKKQTNR